MMRWVYVDAHTYTQMHNTNATDGVGIIIHVDGGNPKLRQMLKIYVFENERVYV